MLIFILLVCAFGVMSRKSLPRPVSRSFFPMFCSWNFMVFHLMFKSGICEWCKIRVQYHCSSCVYPIFPEPLVLPHCAFLAFLSNISWLNMWRFDSGLSILFYWSSCLFLLVPYCLWLCGLTWSQKVWCLWLCSFSSGLLWLSGPFVFHKNFRIFLLLLWPFPLWL